ncbi:MAG: hypothetical protein AAGC60_18725 [Acidobacteriota bacterium]
MEDPFVVVSPVSPPPLVQFAWRQLAARVRRGYAPPPLHSLEPRWFVPSRGADRGSLEPVDLEALAARIEASSGVGFVLPTALGRSRDSLPGRVAELASQIAEVHRETSLPVVLVVGLQWFEGEEDEATTLLDAALRGALDVVEADQPVHLVGLTLRGPGKVETLRTCLPLVSSLGLQGLGWVDDDIELEPGCLARLVAGFLERAGGPRVVGAVKVPHRREEAASRWLFRLKQHMDPAVNYPHGCCMMVDASLLDRGIPARYTCDDGYFCYEILQRVPEQAAQRLALVDEAVCHYSVGAARGRLLPRLRRLLLHHLVFLADYPPPVGARYLSDYLYPGFVPISRRPASDGRRSGPLRWGLQAFHFTCLSAIALELAVRGLIGRPLREIRWSS